MKVKVAHNSVLAFAGRRGRAEASWKGANRTDESIQEDKRSRDASIGDHKAPSQRMRNRVES